MQSNQTIGIDFPLKALAWEDANGETWLSYNNPGWLTRRHWLGVGRDRTVDTIAATLSTIVGGATGRA